MFRILLFLIVLGAIGVGSFMYIQELEAEYLEKERQMRESLSQQQRTNGEDSRRAVEQELQEEYAALRQQLESQFHNKEKTLEDKYGNFDSFKKKLLDSNEEMAQELAQRSKGLNQLDKELAEKETGLTAQTKETNRKLAELKGMNLECKLFDLKKIEDYVKSFQQIAYATRHNVNLLCGLDPTSKYLVNRVGCIRGKEDREKARSLLAMIHSLAANVEQKKAFQDYVSSQRFRMQINP